MILKTDSPSPSPSFYPSLDPCILALPQSPSTEAGLNRATRRNPRTTSHLLHHTPSIQPSSISPVPPHPCSRTNIIHIQNRITASRLSESSLPSYLSADPESDTESTWSQSSMRSSVTETTRQSYSSRTFPPRGLESQDVTHPQSPFGFLTQMYLQSISTQHQPSIFQETETIRRFLTEQDALGLERYLVTCFELRSEQAEFLRRCIYKEGLAI